MNGKKCVSARSAYLFGFLGSLSAIIVAALLSWAFLVYKPGKAAVEKFLFLVSPEKSDLHLAPVEAHVLMNLKADGILISPENLLTATMQYYDTLIVIITIIMSVIGVIAFMYIRVSSQDHVDNMVEEASMKNVEQYFSTADFDEKIMRNIRSDLDDYISLIDNTDVMEARLNRLDNRVEALEEGLSFEDGQIVIDGGTDEELNDGDE